MVLGTAYDFAGLVGLARHHRLLEWIIGEEGELDRVERATFSSLLKRFMGRVFLIDTENFPYGVRFDVLGTTARKRYGITKIESLTVS